MEIKYIKYFIFAIIINIYLIYFKNNNKYPGQIVIYHNYKKNKSFNVSIHPMIKNYYLLKHDIFLSQYKKNIKIFLTKDYKDKNLLNEILIFFVENTEAIDKFITETPISESLFSYSYIIITYNNISQHAVDSYIYQLLYVSYEDYNSIIRLIGYSYNININLLFDNTYDLFPSFYTTLSKYIPILSILLLLYLNREFFLKDNNKCYDIYYNSSILRIIFSIVYLFMTNLKLRANININYFKIPGSSFNNVTDLINNLANDLYISFLIVCIIYIIYNNYNIRQLFNLNERMKKIYTSLYIFFSIMNLPKYFINNHMNIMLFIFFKIIIFSLDIFKIILLLYLYKRQISIISKNLSFYFMNRIRYNDLNHLITKKNNLIKIKDILYIFLFLYPIINNIIFIKYKKHIYYWNIIEKYTMENYTSLFIYFFWMALNIDDNASVLYFNSNNNKNYLKSGTGDEIEVLNDKANVEYNILRSTLKNSHILVLHPYLKRINKENFGIINIGEIE